MSMDLVLDDLDVHVRALEGFADAAQFDVRAAIVEIVVRRGAQFLSLRRSLAELVDGSDNATVADRVAAFERALARPRFGSVARQTERLLVELEIALTAALAGAPTPRTVKLLFGFDAVRSHDARGAVERCLGDRPIQQETVLGGASVSHDLRVDAAARVVAWKFAFAGDAVDLAVTFTTEEADGVDPYSEAAWDTNPSTGGERDQRVVLQYTTRYTRPPSDGDDVGWVFGACRVPGDAPGVVTLEWADVGETSIFSKTLQFQTAVGSVDGTNRDAWTALAETLATSDDNTPSDDSLAWLKAMVALSSLTEWPPENTENPSLDVVLDGGQTAAVSSEEARQKDVQIRELQSKVFRLEEELQTIRQELKTTKSELEISAEIYKASLETITQLETAPARVQTTNHVATSSGGVDNGGDDDADSYGDDGDRDFVSDDDEAEEEPADGETTRLRDLVATFQEQCLWRSIETSESEKRNLLLEAELNQLDRDKQSLLDKLATRDRELAALQADVHKLKAQKTVLVKEVKRLQPYSQVNLSALIREAEEARMMQRSLQAQLQAFTTANTPPEMDHPVAVSENGEG